MLLRHPRPLGAQREGEQAADDVEQPDAWLHTRQVEVHGHECRHRRPADDGQQRQVLAEVLVRVQDDKGRRAHERRGDPDAAEQHDRDRDVWDARAVQPANENDQVEWNDLQCVCPERRVCKERNCTHKLPEDTEGDMERESDAKAIHLGRRHCCRRAGEEGARAAEQRPGFVHRQCELVGPSGRLSQQSGRRTPRRRRLAKRAHEQHARELAAEQTCRHQQHRMLLRHPRPLGAQREGEQAADDVEQPDAWLHTRQVEVHGHECRHRRPADDGQQRQVLAEVLVRVQDDKGRRAHERRGDPDAAEQHDRDRDVWDARAVQPANENDQVEWNDLQCVCPERRVCKERNCTHKLPEDTEGDMERESDAKAIHLDRRHCRRTPSQKRAGFAEQLPRFARHQESLSTLHPRRGVL